MILAVVAVVALFLGYLLCESRWRKWRRGHTALPVTATFDGGVRPLTVEEYERLGAKFLSSLKDPVMGSLGTLRRELSLVNEHMTALEVALKDAMGRAERDREQTRQERMLSEDAKIRLHSEIKGLHAAILLLTTAATETKDVLLRVEQSWK